MIKRLLIVFGKPETEDVKAYLTEVALATKGFSESIQEEACTLLMKTYKSNRFPKPAECRKACESVCEERGQSGQRTPIAPMNPEWSKASLAAADNLIRCDLGRRAANEGWVLGLHDFCRKKNRLPQNNEIGALMASAKEFDASYRQAQIMKGPLGAAIVELGTTMLARRDRCARVTDGEVLP